MTTLRQTLSAFRFIRIMAMLASMSLLTAYATGATSSSWVQVYTPILNDLRHLSFFTPEFGMVAGRQILVYKHGQWRKCNNQPPAPVNLFFAVDTNAFFITSKTKYQESDLYFGDGNSWHKLNNPLASTISAIYFNDRENGVVAGLGEIILLENNHWKWLPPPTNRYITSVFLSCDSVVWALAPIAGLYKHNGNWIKIKDSEKVNHMRQYQGTTYVLGDDFLGIINTHDSITVLSTCSKLKNISSFFVINKNEMIAVGIQGLIMHFTNGQWQSVESGISENLNTVWMTDENSGWIAGNNGTILRYTSDESGFFQPKIRKGFKTVTMLDRNVKILDDEYGVVAADFNNDGLVDVFTCGLFEANHLYMNRGNFLFSNRSEKWNLTENKNSAVRELKLGACAADFNNDGYQDLYVTSLNSSNKLYKNIKGNYFINYSNISKGTGASTDRTNAVISGDVDNDGDLDIFITNENSTNRLFLNNGVGIFSEEVTEQTGLTTNFGGMGCSFGDIDNDGDLDLYVANWSAKNILYRNLLKESGTLTFEDITDEAGVGGEAYTKSNAVVFADIDNDADIDLFVTNRKTSNKLYINNGQGMFEDKTASILGIDTLKSYGAVIADFDGDGFKDLYISNVGRNSFYINIEGKKFADNTAAYSAGGGEGYSTGSAAADIDNNGIIDIYQPNYLGESSMILRNNNSGGNFIRVKATGYENNRSGIGSKIYVYKDNGPDKVKQLISYMEISGGSGYASMNQRFLPVPAPEIEFVDVKVIFPNGKIKTVKHVRTGSTLLVEDVTGIKKNLLLTGHWWKRQVKDPHQRIRLISWVIVVLVIVFAMKRGVKRHTWSWMFISGFSVLLTILFYAQSTYFEFKNIWLANILPILSVFLFVSLIHLYYERRSIKAAALAEQKRIQENLSRDLHDDLASTISAISIYLTLIRYQLKDTEKKLTALLDKTMALSTDASSAMTDLIWAITPKPEPLGNLVGRINNNFASLFKEQKVRFSTNGRNLENIVLNAQTRKNVYLIIKEALNNILKYAEASDVRINIVRHKQKVHLSITDNGKGFDQETAKRKGHGLTNMYIRASEIGARIEIKSVISKGTEIRLIFHPGHLKALILI